MPSQPTQSTLAETRRPVHIRRNESAVSTATLAESDVLEELRARCEAAEAANRCKDELLATIGHDLRNPLAAILTAAFLLREKARVEGGNAREAELILRQGETIKRMVDEMFDVAYLGAGKLELRRRLVDPREVVASAVLALQDLIEERRHVLSVELSPEAIALAGDPERLTQIVTNLLENAAKYSPQGSRIWVTLEALGDEVTISVRDTGMGIAPDHLAEAFELIKRHRNPEAVAASGLGLGLVVAQKLAVLHGGNVEGTSEGLGKGSVFVLRLPRELAMREAGAS